MLKLPNLEISQKAYNEHIDNLLQDSSCIIFLDTNVLAKMFALYKGARDEFATWIVTAKLQNRVKVPAWCIQEYSNKAVRGELKQYTSNFSSSLKTTLKILPQLISQLALSVDDAAAVRKGFANRQDYLTSVSEAREELLKLLPDVNSAKGNIDDPATIHKELIQLFSDVILPSDIFALMQGCYQDYEMRYANKVPPGFQDEKKEQNKIGDYIIWRELLQTVKDSIDTLTGEPAIQKLLYVSSDLKNDWVYRPTRVINARNKSVGNPEEGGIYLVDPRLEYEMSLAAGRKVDIMLVSFEQLVSSLTQQHSGSFTLLASAVQLINAAEPSVNAAATENIAADTTGGDNATDISDENPGTLTQPDAVPNVQPDVTGSVPVPAAPVAPYSTSALADAQYSIPNSTIGYIISDLKSYTWDTQNKGIGKITSAFLNAATPDELFVLGRNILQTAEGSSFSARYFLERFPNNLAGTAPNNIGHLFNGLLYEIYFDSKNQFRGAKGKTLFLNSLYKIYRNSPELKLPKEFIQSVLESHKDAVLFIPDLNETVHTITLSFIASQHASFRYKLEACLIDGNVISQEIDEFGDTDTQHLLRLRSYDGEPEELLAAIAESRYIPTGFYSGAYTLGGQPIDKPATSDFHVPTGLYA